MIGGQHGMGRGELAHVPLSRLGACWHACMPLYMRLWPARGECCVRTVLQFQAQFVIILLGRFVAYLSCATAG